MDEEQIISRKRMLLAFALIIIGFAVLIWAIWPSDQPPATSSQANPPQAALPINNTSSSFSAAGLQSGSGDVQSSTVNSQAASASTQNSSSAQSTSSTPTAPSYPPCNSCTPAAGHVCPDFASYPCSCGGAYKTEPNDSIACEQQ